MADVRRGFLGPQRLSADNESGRFGGGEWAALCTDASGRLNKESTTADWPESHQMAETEQTGSLTFIELTLAVRKARETPLGFILERRSGERGHEE